MTEKKYRSILEDLNDYIMNENKYISIKIKAEHILTAADNFSKYVYNNIPEEEADLIIEKFISALKNKKPNKFKNFYNKFLKDKEIKIDVNSG